MEKIPTAEEVIDKMVKFASVNDTINCTVYSLSQVMVEFAKLHVEAALKTASEKAEISNKPKFPGDYNLVIDEESILNSYPLENIK